MTRTVRAMLEGPTVLRLEEPVELPLHVTVEVTISVPTAGQAEPSAFLRIASTFELEGPADLSEHWEEYEAADEQGRSQ